MILHASEAGRGPAVGLLHGLFGQGRNLGLVARGLAAERRMIAMDLRNHGRSPHAPAMTYPDMASDVLETLAARGAGRAALLGHSMGGKVAMTAALLHPDRVERLLVADIAPAAYRPGDFHGYVAAMLALPPVPAREADALLAGAVPDPAVRAFLLQNRNPDGTWRAALPAIRDALPRIEGWDVPEGARYDGPVLFVLGGRSGYLREEHRPGARVLFPRARFVTLRGAGHWVHADEPGAFLEVVRGFLLAGE